MTVYIYEKKKKLPARLVRKVKKIKKKLLISINIFYLIKRIFNNYNIYIYYI